MMNIITIILISSLFSWWITSNTIIEYILSKIKLDFLLCEKCIAAWMAIFYSILNGIYNPLILIAIGSASAILAIGMKRFTDKISL